MDKCPVCTALWYKIRKDDPGDIEGEPPRKRVPAKVMWYAPIIPRLKCLFRNKDHAKLLRCVTSQVFKKKKPSCIHGILHKCDSYRILKHIPSNIAVPFTLLYKFLK
jgi:hypothetical protein